MAFSPDGRTLASASADGTIRRWTVPEGAPLGAVISAHDGGVNGVAFSPDGSAIASGGADAKVRLWDAVTGQPIGATLEGPQKAINSVAFAPNGQALVAGSHDGLVWRWRLVGGLPGGDPPQSLAQQAGDRSAVWGVAYSPDGLHLAAGRIDGNVALWSTAARRPLPSCWRDTAWRCWPWPSIRAIRCSPTETKTVPSGCSTGIWARTSRRARSL